MAEALLRAIFLETTAMVFVPTATGVPSRIAEDLFSTREMGKHSTIVYDVDVGHRGPREDFRATATKKIDASKMVATVVGKQHPLEE